MRYLLITFFRKPGGQIDEHAEISKKVKDTDFQTCNLIMDYAERKLVKCVIEGERRDLDFDKLDEYYHRHHPSFITQLRREATTEAKVEQAQEKK